MTVLYTEDVTEVMVFAVPSGWSLLPDDMLEAKAWWMLVEGSLQQKNVIYMGPPRDIRWCITDDPAAIEAFELTHLCEECITARESAVLETKMGRKVAMVEYIQGYLRQLPGAPTAFPAR